MQTENIPVAEEREGGRERKERRELVKAIKQKVKDKPNKRGGERAEQKVPEIRVRKGGKVDVSERVNGER